MKRILLLLLISLISFSNTAHTMSRCMEPENLIEEYPVIFKGRVIQTGMNQDLKEPFEQLMEEIEGLRDNNGEAGRAAYIWAFMFMGDPQVTEFEVVETYKGLLPNRIKLYHRLNSLRGEKKGVVGASYKTGESYVVMANVNDLHHHTSSSCDTYFHPHENDRKLEEIFNLKHKLDKLNKNVAENPNSAQHALARAEHLEDIKDFQRAEALYKIGIDKYKADLTALKAFEGGLSRTTELKNIYLGQQKNKDLFYVTLEQFQEASHVFKESFNELLLKFGKMEFDK